LSYAACYARKGKGADLDWPAHSGNIRNKKSAAYETEQQRVTVLGGSILVYQAIPGRPPKTILKINSLCKGPCLKNECKKQHEDGTVKSFSFHRIPSFTNNSMSYVRSSLQTKRTSLHLLSQQLRGSAGRILSKAPLLPHRLPARYMLKACHKKTVLKYKKTSNFKLLSTRRLMSPQHGLNIEKKLCTFAQTVKICTAAVLM
jgi:hypothetical protein